MGDEIVQCYNLQHCNKTPQKADGIYPIYCRNQLLFCGQRFSHRPSFLRSIPATDSSSGHTQSQTNMFSYPLEARSPIIAAFFHWRLLPLVSNHSVSDRHGSSGAGAWCNAVSSLLWSYPGQTSFFDLDQSELHFFSFFCLLWSLCDLRKIWWWVDIILGMPQSISF